MAVVFVALALLALAAKLVYDFLRIHLGERKFVPETDSELLCLSGSAMAT
jgi:hypothetical protein